MENDEIYRNVFITALGVSEDELETLTYKSKAEWNSIGHFILISGMEQAFSITMDSEDVLDFNSFISGKKILQKYGINI